MIDTVDCVVVGAGVVGLAVARAQALQGREVMVLEAADAFGSSNRQKLFNVQLPLALPTIMTGINQTIMMALAMVVVASMVGVGGLGKNVLQAINNQFFTVGFLNGFALVAIAIIFDRTSQAYGKRLQKHSEVIHG